MRLSSTEPKIGQGIETNIKTQTPHSLLSEGGTQIEQFLSPNFDQYFCCRCWCQGLGLCIQNKPSLASRWTNKMLSRSMHTVILHYTCELSFYTRKEIFRSPNSSYSNVWSFHPNLVKWHWEVDKSGHRMYIDEELSLKINPGVSLIWFTLHAQSAPQKKPWAKRSASDQNFTSVWISLWLWHQGVTKSFLRHLKCT